MPLKEKTATEHALTSGIVALAILLQSAAASHAQQQPQVDCAQVAPVCALNNGTRQTYWNACLAARDGAQLLYAGACRQSRSYG